MSLEQAFEKPIVFAPEERVSRAISEMYRKRRHEALISKDSKFLGILTARDLAKRKINEPYKAQVRKFIRRISLLLPGSDVEDVMNAMLVNDFKSVPVKDSRGRIFFVTKLGLLAQVRKNSAFKNRQASDVMVPPYCVGSDDSIATAMSVIRHANISRLPVVDKENRAMGLLDSIDLLKADINRSRSAVGEQAGNSIKLRDVLATSLMQKNVAKTGPDTPVTRVIDIMLGRKTQTVLVEKGGRLVGIITPKLIMKLIGKRVGGVYVRISGLQKEDGFIKSVVDEQIRNEVRKLGKFIPIEFMVIHVDRYHETGNRIKYSVKSTLATQKGTFYADDHAWDITKAIRGILEKFEKEVIRKKERAKVYRRG